VCMLLIVFGVARTFPIAFVFMCMLPIARDLLWMFPYISFFLIIYD
jgi:hypothetical protein